MFHTQSFERRILHSGWQIQLRGPLLYTPPPLTLAKTIKQGEDGIAACQKKRALFPPPHSFLPSLPPPSFPAAAAVDAAANYFSA